MREESEPTKSVGDGGQKKSGENPTESVSVGAYWLKR
jgi:hypothetical protein